MQAVGGDGVRDDGGAGVVGREDCRHHGNECVAADIRTVREDGAHAVDVGVEDESEVGVVLDDGFLDGEHCLRILGVRDVVREVSVGVEVAAARGVCAERGEDAPREESARTVARVDDDVHARERLFLSAECCADFLDEVLAVAANEVKFQHVVEGAVRLLGLCSVGEDLLDVLLVRAARSGEEFQPIAVVGEVARGDHDGAVRRRVLEDGRHEHGGGGGEDAVDAVCARVCEPREDAVLDGERGDARVVADGDLQFLGLLTGLLRE